jgi:predicted RNA-binding protein with PIN domain
VYAGTSAAGGLAASVRCVIVLVDAPNVRRSVWPNFSPEQLVELLAMWGSADGLDVVAVFDGPAPEPADGVDAVGTDRESADDWIANRAAELDEPYILVTSDRELRERAGTRAERVIGGGTLAKELQALRDPESPSA